MKQFLLLLLLVVHLYAIDNDFDGVEDGIDRCLDSSFEDLVGVDGCAISDNYIGEFNLESNYFDEYINLYFDYSYDNYLFSFEQIYSEIYEDKNYLYLGYRLFFEKSVLDNYIGTTINTTSFSSTFTYLQNELINYLMSLSYILDERDYCSFSTGVTYSDLNYNLALSYLNSGDTLKFIGQYQSINIVGTYSFLNNYYLKIGYDKSILSSKDENIYIGIGVSFE